MQKPPILLKQQSKKRMGKVMVGEVKEHRWENKRKVKM